MSDVNPVPSNPQPPAGTPNNKGMSTGGKVALGCTIVFVIGCTVIGLLTWQAYKKGKEIWDEFVENPTGSIAKSIIKTHPDLDFVSVDEDGNIYTVRNKQDGKEYTVELDQITSGKLTLTDSEGNKVSMGSADSSEIPEWVPRPPGLEEIIVPYIVTENGKSSGLYTAKLTADPESTVELSRASKVLVPPKASAQNSMARVGGKCISKPQSTRPTHKSSSNRKTRSST